MLIRISTDRATHGGEELIRHFEPELAARPARFSDHITRQEVHFSEETTADDELVLPGASIHSEEIRS